MEELIFKKGNKGRCGFTPPKIDVPYKGKENLIPEKYLRTTPVELPEVSEQEAVRHYTRLSNLNYSIDTGFYPLGSCTMKYNPKINEAAASLSGLKDIHPLQDDESLQGALQILHELSEYMKEILGMHSVTLLPSAGAQGEFTGVLITRAYFLKKKETRTKIVIPDSAHGTNPASAFLGGFDIETVKTGPDGLIDIEELERKFDDKCALLMLTNPNTLGLFEKNILKINEIVHRQGGLLYMDGANLNALLGITRPGDMGFDIVHVNFHKTFSTPHGGGGPGAGGLGVSEKLSGFLPVPLIIRDDTGTYHRKYDCPDTIGHIHTFLGNFGVLIRAYTYIKMLGSDGIGKIGKNSIINANYLKKRLEPFYNIPYNQPCMHEMVLSASKQKTFGVRAWDIAKRLIDYGFHPPTVYFPMIVEEAMMIEPVETETKETIDQFCNAMIKIAEESEKEPNKVTESPNINGIGRIDEAKAAKKPDVKYKKA